MGRTARVNGGNFKREVKRVEIMANATEGESLDEFKARMERAAPQCKMFGKPMELSGEYQRRYVPRVGAEVWTTTLMEQHYAQ